MIFNPAEDVSHTSQTGYNIYRPKTQQVPWRQRKTLGIERSQWLTFLFGTLIMCGMIAFLAMAGVWNLYFAVAMIVGTFLFLIAMHLFIRVFLGDDADPGEHA